MFLYYRYGVFKNRVFKNRVFKNTFLEKLSKVGESKNTYINLKT